MDAYIRERSFNLKKCVVSCLFSSEVTLRVERPQAGVRRGRAGGVGVPFGAVSSVPALRERQGDTESLVSLVWCLTRAPDLSRLKPLRRHRQKANLLLPKTFLSLVVESEPYFPFCIVFWYLPQMNIEM